MPLKDVSTGKTHPTKKDHQELKKELAEFAKSSDGASDFLEMLLDSHSIGLDEAYEIFKEKRKDKENDKQ